MFKRTYKLLLTVLLIFSLSACSFKADPVILPLATETDAGFDYSSASVKISDASGLDMTPQFLESMGENIAEKLVSSIDSGTYNEKIWLSLTGYSYHVI